MIIDVPTTKRKPLTKLQRAKLFEAHGGICVICKTAIDRRKVWIDEHIKPLGLGGSNDLANRGPAHFDCAAVKTQTEDMPRINEAKAQNAAGVGKDPMARPTFKKAPKVAKAPRDQLPLPPRRAMFQ